MCTSLHSSLICSDLVLPFYKVCASVRLRLAVAQESTKSLKTLLVLRAKTFERTKPKYCASDYFKVNTSAVNANRFISIFRSNETSLFVNSHWAALVYQHFPMIQCTYKPLLHQSLVAHRIVKRDNWMISTNKSERILLLLMKVSYKNSNCHYLLPSFCHIFPFLFPSGILMWEVFSGGKTPYATMTNVDVVEQVTRKGYRMEKPESCPEEIYRVMMKCWRDVSMQLSMQLIEYRSVTSSKFRFCISAFS